MTNKTIPLPGATGGKLEGDFVFLTRRIRIPRSAIITVKRARDGEGSTVVTDRGAMRVCEDFGALMLYLYGVEVETARGGAAK